MDTLFSKTTELMKIIKNNDLVFLKCPKGIEQMEKYLFKEFH